MKIKFSGWSRKVYSHSHDVLPITGGPKRRHPVGKAGEPVKWDDASRVRGRVNGLGLTGDFLVEFEFQPQELECWLRAYAKEQPEAAVRMLGSVQAEAIIALSAQVQSEK